MTGAEQIEVWRRSIAECATLRDFNKFIVPAMKTRGDTFKMMAATEAKRRGYAPNKEKGIYE